ncbi:MAG TPA: helix-turn-helix transcriptional regulator [Solirubrobacteraceae bacterium]|nr:helix-turn-helix transcriptional regulator [Solirubrobacteraceae bacterium]
MLISEVLTDDAVLAELGRRIERHRLQRNWTQEQLAFKAQIGRATVQRLERGTSVQGLSLIKVLRALDLLEGLQAAIPAAIELPIAELERERRAFRTRARNRNREAADEPTHEQWRWADPGA